MVRADWKNLVGAQGCTAPRERDLVRGQGRRKGNKPRVLYGDPGDLSPVPVQPRVPWVTVGSLFPSSAFLASPALQPRGLLDEAMLHSSKVRQMLRFCFCLFQAA